MSVILLSYYSNERIVKTFEKVDLLLAKENIPFEFIIMDDGSKDKSFKISKQLEKRNQGKVFAYQLSKNYTTSYSIFAGLLVSKGACAVAIPDDEQQPYETLVQMYRLWEKGEKIIIPHRKDRNDKGLHSWFSNLFYYTINRLSDIKYPPGGADLFFIDREIIDIINNGVNPRNTYIIPEILRLGFEPHFLPYNRPKSVRRKSRWNFKKRYRLAKNIFLSSSSAPIKFISTIGILTSLFSVLLIIFYLYIKLFGNEEFWGEFIPGWTSLIIIISFFSGLILFALGIIAEYIWRIYEEVKNRPSYIIKKKENGNKQIV